MSYISKKYYPYTVKFEAEGLRVFIRKEVNGHPVMILCISYEVMFKKFPKYGRPRSDYLMCIDSGEICKIKGYLSEYGAGKYFFGNKEFRKIERWEWDLRASLQRSSDDNNGKFFKAVQDAYKSQFGE